MGKLSKLKNGIKTKIETVKRISDTTKTDVEEARKKGSDRVDSFLKDLPSTDSLFGKKLSDYAANKKNNKEQKTDIFGDLLGIVEGFVGTNKVVEINDAMANKQKLKQITMTSVHNTLQQSKPVIMDNVKKALFAGDGICGTNLKMPKDSVNIKPQEFDFMNVLTVDPQSNSGKIVYEGDTNTGFVKMNQVLYSGFTNSQTFTTKDNKDLFDVSWNSSTQEYTFSSLTGGTQSVEDFVTQYYSNIEFLDISGVTKNAMLMSLQGDGNEPPLFDKGWNDLNRLLAKLCASCGSPSTGLNPSTAAQFNENDEDADSYFDFNSTEGIDLDDERNRYDKVLKFKDCGNYQIKTNPQHFEDFVYSKKNLNDSVSDALLHSAGEIFEKSGQSQPLDNFHISLMNTFILNLPKALVGAVLSPKYMLPVVILNKAITEQELDSKEIMRRFSKMYTQIIRDLYWIFLAEFWKLVKVELLKLLSKTAAKILKNQLIRYSILISTLISLLNKILSQNLDNCNSLYQVISDTIDAALSVSIAGLPTPPFLLLMAAQKPGYSTDRAFMNITEKLQQSGMDIGPIYGESNNVLDLVKSVVDGNDEELVKNGKVEVGVIGLSGISSGFGHAR
jgi:hypothetical protein